MAEPIGSNRAAERVWRSLPGGAREQLETNLPPTDLQSLLFSVAAARGYYTTAAMRLAADAGALEIGDGGFTNWTAQLAGDAKERCLVSCIATERLAELTSQA